MAANLLMVFLILSGLLASFNVTSEVFPEITLDRIQVEVPYLGAAPKEVEEAVSPSSSSNPLDSGRLTGTNWMVR